MPTLSILYKDKIEITDYISVVIPSVRDVVNNQDDYYSVVDILTSMPIDKIVELDEAGIDFTKINEYEMFLLMFDIIKEMDTKLVFGDLDLNDFEIRKDEKTEKFYLLNPSTGAVVNRVVHAKIADTLRMIHHLDKNRRKPGNDAAKEYMIQRAKEKRSRMKHKKTESQLENMIIAAVNAYGFKYDFEGVLNLTIYQFNESVRQLDSRIWFDNRMHGVYAGTVSAKDLSQDEMNWLSRK